MPRKSISRWHSRSSLRPISEKPSADTLRLKASIKRRLSEADEGNK